MLPNLCGFLDNGSLILSLCDMSPLHNVPTLPQENKLDKSHILSHQPFTQRPVIHILSMREGREGLLMGFPLPFCPSTPHSHCTAGEGRSSTSISPM